MRLVEKQDQEVKHGPDRFYSIEPVFDPCLQLSYEKLRSSRKLAIYTSRWFLRSFNVSYKWIGRQIGADLFGSPV